MRLTKPLALPRMKTRPIHDRPALSMAHRSSQVDQAVAGQATTQKNGGGSTKESGDVHFGGFELVWA